MADIIRLLPDSVANQIAAGEVIQRPSSVVKELVENAADAGATQIDIVVRDAGRTLIQVTDNGRGMSPTDARMAFERHATSKIRRAEDLFALRTMGFRGEALPSICAIAQVELRSAVKEEPTGTHLLINGSEVVGQEPCVCPVGTTMMVKNIFYNVPARRRFLKSDSVELSNIMREFERLALVNHTIRFTLDTGGRRRDLRGGSFKQRITDLWHNSLNPELLPVEVVTDIVRISGFISRPEHARRRNALQYLVANGRCMHHPYFIRAIASCYERLIAPDTKPCYFLRFDVAPARIDVNIHPTKNEIKFEDEQEIYRLLTSAVHATLGKYGVVPSIDFGSDALEVHPLTHGEKPSAPASAGDPGYNPFSQQRASADRWRPQMQRDWQALYRGFTQGTPGTDGQPRLPLDSSEPIPSAFNPGGMGATASRGDTAPGATALPPICMQLDQSYIVAPSRDGLMIIDQHRAHVAILYARFMRRADDPEQYAPQGLLFGSELRLDARQEAVLQEALPQLESMGITLRRQGDGWAIASLPTMLGDAEAGDVILQTLDALQTDSDQYGRATTDCDTLRRRVALGLARSAAIHRGKTLSPHEMEKILSELLRLASPDTGPDGKRILLRLRMPDIGREFV